MPRILTFVVLLITSLTAWADTISGTVVGITDGDTVTVLDAAREQHRIRLAGIDAPEKAQPFSERSRQYIASLVFSMPVRVEWHKRDRYDRIIGVAWVAPPGQPCTSASCPMTHDANLAMVSAGYAWHYKHYEREQTAKDRARYASAEEAAREKQLGLWHDPAPTPPWDWRAAKRNGAQVAEGAVR